MPEGARSSSDGTSQPEGETRRIHFSDDDELLPTDAVSRGVFKLVQFDPEQYDEPWAVYENQAGALTLLGDGETAGKALAEAGKTLDEESGPRGDYRV